MNMYVILLDWRQDDWICGRLFSCVITDGVDINVHKNKQQQKRGTVSVHLEDCTSLILPARGDSNRIKISNYINDK